VRTPRDLVEALVIVIIAFALGFIAGSSWCGR
jgi:hypothetical protein